MTVRWSVRIAAGTAVATLAGLLAADVAAQDTTTESTQFEARPSQADFERLGPPVAVRDRVSGRATLDCALTAAGRLRDCKIKGETPAGQGFGEAALRLTPYYRVARTEEVELEGSRLPFTVRFRYAEFSPPALAGAAPAPVAPPPPVSAAPPEIASISAPSGRLMRLGAVP